MSRRGCETSAWWLEAAIGAAIAALAASGCVVSADYDGTTFSCAEPPHNCPSGYQCVSGTCRLDAPDARPLPDSAGAMPDAPDTDAQEMCATPPTVDGDPSEPVWDGGWVSIAKLVVGVNDDGVSAEIAARWSSTHLYVAWQDDSIELYLDMEHDRTTSYEADDFQYMFPWSDDAIWEQSDRTDGIVYAHLTTAEGYSGETAIPWTTLATAPSVGAEYGFDAGCNFDQDSGDRDGQLMWTGTADNYADTSAFGTATLADACAVTLSM